MPLLAQIDVPTAGVATRIVTAFTIQYPDQWAAAQLAGKTAAQFAKAMVIKYITDTVEGAEAPTAAESARQTAIANVRAQVVPT